MLTDEAIAHETRRWEASGLHFRHYMKNIYRLEYKKYGEDNYKCAGYFKTIEQALTKGEALRFKPNVDHVQVVIVEVNDYHETMLSS